MFIEAHQNFERLTAQMHAKQIIYLGTPKPEASAHTRTLSFYVLF
jgi:hypothetical protein